MEGKSKLKLSPWRWLNAQCNSWCCPGRSKSYSRKCWRQTAEARQNGFEVILINLYPDFKRW